jgi:1-acyl-sn-glycerol-3-phosphate acyltransferase
MLACATPFLLTPMNHHPLNQKTIFHSSFWTKLLHKLSLTIFRWRGWRLEGKLPPLKKYVIIGAPHTSNWDFPLALGLAFSYHVPIYWMGKHTLFRWPVGGLMRWLGGIAVNRDASQNLVAQSVEAMQQSDSFVLAIPPEGTRQRVRYWKTGFYHIAQQANVPIVLAFLDYENKAAGFGPTFTPTGDLAQDMQTIQAYYAPIQGKHPQQFAASETGAKPL